MKSTVKTVSPLDKIARKHGISGDELKAELEKDKQREKRAKRKIKQKEKEVAENKRTKMEHLLTVRLPMDCVNYIIGFMDPTVRFEIDRLLTQDRIERVYDILCMMESEEILKHMNHGRLHFIIDYAEDLDAYNLANSQFYNEQKLLRETDGSRKFVRFRSFDYYRQKFYDAIREINQDTNTILYNNKNKYIKNKYIYDLFYKRNYPEDVAIEQFKKYQMSIQLQIAFEYMHDRSKPKEVHQRLDKMLNIIMRLPKKFTLDQPKSIKSWSRY